MFVLLSYALSELLYMQAMLSPALETALEYHLKVLAIAITYGGSVLLQLRDELKLAIGCAFQAPSWKVLK